MPFNFFKLIDYLKALQFRNEYSTIEDNKSFKTEFITQLLRWNEFSKIIFKKNMYSMPENCALNENNDLSSVQRRFFLFHRRRKYSYGISPIYQRSVEYHGEGNRGISSSRRPFVLRNTRSSCFSLGRLSN